MKKTTTGLQFGISFIFIILAGGLLSHLPDDFDLTQKRNLFIGGASLLLWVSGYLMKSAYSGKDGEYYGASDVDDGNEFRIISVRSVNSNDEIYFFSIEFTDYTGTKLKEVYLLSTKKELFDFGRPPMEDELYHKKDGKFVLTNNNPFIKN